MFVISGNYFPDWLHPEDWLTPLTDHERSLIVWVVLANVPLLMFLAKVTFGSWDRFRLAWRLLLLSSYDRAHLPYQDQKLHGLLWLFFFLSMFLIAAEVDILHLLRR